MNSVLLNFHDVREGGSYTEDLVWGNFCFVLGFFYLFLVMSFNNKIACVQILVEMVGNSYFGFLVNPKQCYRLNLPYPSVI